MMLAVFLSIAGTAGVIVSAFAMIVTGFEKKYVIPFSIVFGMAFLFASAGYKMQDEAPIKERDVAQMASWEYYDCLARYNRQEFIDNHKISVEQFCSNLNVIFQKKVLSAGNE